MASDVRVSQNGQDPNNPQPHVFSQSTIYNYRPLPEGTPTCRMCDIPMYANRTDTICTACSRIVEKLKEAA